MLTVANNNTYSGGTPSTRDGCRRQRRDDRFARVRAIYQQRVARLQPFRRGYRRHVVSGSGSLAQNGSGNLTLSAFNTYTGGTTVNAGTLTLTAGGTGAGNIVGTLTINPGGDCPHRHPRRLRLQQRDHHALTVLNINGGTLDKLPQHRRQRDPDGCRRQHDRRPLGRHRRLLRHVHQRLRRHERQHPAQLDDRDDFGVAEFPQR